MHRQELKELTDAVLQHLSEEYAPYARIPVDPSSYAYFKEFASSLRTAPRQSEPTLKTQQHPLHRPSIPLKKEKTAPNLQPKAIAQPALPAKDEPAQEMPQQEKTPSSFTLQSQPLPQAEEFSTFRSILAKHFPAQKIVEEHSGNLKSDLPKIIIVAPRHPVFLNLANAMREKFPSFDTYISDQPGEAALVIADRERVAGFGGTSCPTIMLKPAEAYLENPALKRELWNEIVKTLNSF